MRIETTIREIYTFSELSEDAKEAALNNCRDYNTNHDWWEFTFEDAENAGLKITSFDLDRNRHAQGEWITSAKECAKSILDGHGETCETYKTAKAFLDERNELVNTWPKDEDGELENGGKLDDELDDLENEFLESIVEDYSIILQNECEYLQSDEAVEEAIQSNEYEFTEDGEHA